MTSSSGADQSSALTNEEEIIKTFSSPNHLFSENTYKATVFDTLPFLSTVSKMGKQVQIINIKVEGWKTDGTVTLNYLFRKRG